MANPRETQTLQSWSSASQGSDWDDDFIDDELLLNEEEFDSDGFYYDGRSVTGSMTSRQRIEMARENSKLLSSLNFLDINEDFEYPQDDSAEYSY